MRTAFRAGGRACRARVLPRKNARRVAVSLSSANIQFLCNLFTQVACSKYRRIYTCAKASAQGKCQPALNAEQTWKASAANDRCATMSTLNARLCVCIQLCSSFTKPWVVQKKTVISSKHYSMNIFFLGDVTQNVRFSTKMCIKLKFSTLFD